MTVPTRSTSHRNRKSKFFRNNDNKKSMATTVLSAAYFCGNAALYGHRSGMYGDNTLLQNVAENHRV